jgi:ABC-type branched-subunit amino acid transport system permease subunit
MQVTKSIFIQRALLGVFWVLGTVGFVCDEFVPGLESLRSYILLACDAVLVLIGLMTLRHKADFLFIGSLLLIALTSSLVLNKLPITMTVNGIRVFFGVMFCYPIFRYFWDDPNRRDRFIKAFDKNLEVFLWL